MFATMASACQNTAPGRRMNGGVCLTCRERKDERGWEEGRWENLIAGCTVIQEVRNVSDKQIFDLLSAENLLT